MNCDSCNKEIDYDKLNWVYINVSAYSFGKMKNPNGIYELCDDCLGVTKKSKEVRQVTDPPVEKPLGMFAKIKQFIGSIGDTYKD